MTVIEFIQNTSFNAMLLFIRGICNYLFVCFFQQILYQKKMENFTSSVMWPQETRCEVPVHPSRWVSMFHDQLYELSQSIEMSMRILRLDKPNSCVSIPPLIAIKSRQEQNFPFLQAPSVQHHKLIFL